MLCYYEIHKLIVNVVVALFIGTGQEIYLIGVLFYRARLSKVAELRSFVVSLLDVTRHLREQNDGDLKLFRHYLHRSRNIRYFLLFARFSLSVGAFEKLQIVYDDKIESALLLSQSSALRHYLLRRYLRGIVYVHVGIGKKFVDIAYPLVVLFFALCGQHIFELYLRHSDH